MTVTITETVDHAPLTERERYQNALHWWQEHLVQLEAKKIEHTRQGIPWEDGDERLIVIAQEYCGIYVRQLLESDAA